MRSALIVALCVAAAFGLEPTARLQDLKLTYFNIRGRAEPARLLLHYAGIAFEDERIKKDDWPKLKTTVPFGQLPILTVGDRVLAESWTIFRYLGRHADLNGKSEWEATYLDEISELFRDWHDVAFSYSGLESGHRPGNATEFFENYYIPTSNRFLPLVERQLDKPHGFIGESGISWLDFLVADVFERNYAKHPEVLGDYKKLIAHSEKVLSLPQLQSYLKSRPSNE